MDLKEIFLIAISISMDAFAVSITLGVCSRKLSLINFLLPAITFGFFQSIMPVIGYITCSFFSDIFHVFDHWIAFVLLLALGIKMIKDRDNHVVECYSYTALFVMAFATSIDALVIGITFAFFEIDLLVSVMIIGAITFLFCLLGVKIGNKFGSKYKSKAEVLGGIMLILIGVNVLFKHLLS